MAIKILEQRLPRVTGRVFENCALVSRYAFAYICEITLNYFVASSSTETHEVSPPIIPPWLLSHYVTRRKVDAATRFKRQVHLYSPAVPILANRLSGAARKRRWFLDEPAFPARVMHVSSNQRNQRPAKVNKASSVFLSRLLFPVPSKD